MANKIYVETLVDGSVKLTFRDAQIFIHSNADGELTIEADTKITIGVAGTIDLGDGTLRLIRPQTNEKESLGDASNRFFNLFLGGDIDLDDASNIVLDTTTGTKIGTSTSQKVGFFNATPVVQQTGYAIPTDLAECITALTTLRTAVNNLGLTTAV